MIKAGLPSYWYADKIWEVFEVEQLTLSNHEKFTYKVVNSESQGCLYFDHTDIEIINEEKQMFDLKKEKWFIYTPTQESSRIAQEWLFAQGLVWQHHRDTKVRYTESLYLKLSPFTAGAFCHTDSIDLKYDQSKEVKLTIKTIVDSVEYPKIETPEQKQLQEVMTKISELQAQAEKLQGLIYK